MLGAVALTVLLVATWYAAFHIGIVKHADESVLRGFTGLKGRPRVSSLALFVAKLCDPKPYVYFCAAPVLIALARRRLWVTLAVVTILLGANVTTQLLKPLLAEPRPANLLAGTLPPAPASWPSGHATAAMSLALCLVLAVPARARPFVAALGAAFAVAVSYSFLTLEWHYPSDVLGGFLVAAIWTLLAVAAVLTADARLRLPGPSGPPQRLSVRAALGPPSAVLLGALALAGLVALARPREVVAYARLHEPFVVGALAIGALGLALATGVMLALRR